MSILSPILVRPARPAPTVSTLRSRPDLTPPSRRPIRLIRLARNRAEHEWREPGKNALGFRELLPNDSPKRPAIIKLAVTKRRSLTPIAGMPPVVPGTHAMRRGDARKEVSDRVTVKAIRREVGGDDTGGTVAVCEGWALNASRGGLRAIVETNESGIVLELGGEYDVIVGDPEAVPSKKARVVWVQDEPDGVVVGFEFIGLSGTHRAAISSGPPAPLSGNAQNVSGTTAKAPAVTFATESDSAMPVSNAASNASNGSATRATPTASDSDSASGRPDSVDDALPTPIKE